MWDCLRVDLGLTEKKGREEVGKAYVMSVGHPNLWSRFVLIVGFARHAEASLSQ